MSLLNMLDQPDILKTNIKATCKDIHGDLVCGEELHDPVIHMLYYHRLVFANVIKRSHMQHPVGLF